MNNNPVVICESDFPILKKLSFSQINRDGTMSLASEVQRAIVVRDSAFPVNTIRINSRVKVTDLDSGEVYLFNIVLPEQADIKQKKISVLAPMGAALIGFREGDEVSWKMPRGVKRIKVLEVANPTSL